VNPIDAIVEDFTDTALAVNAMRVDPLDEALIKLCSRRCTIGDGADFRLVLTLPWTA
jgi:hypothetical protein